MILDKSTLLDAYRRLKTIREFELRMRTENEAGQLPGFLHLYCGQEAIAVGACMQLDKTDYIGSTHRGHGHCIAKGCDVGDMLLEIYCKQGGLCNGKGGSMHIADINKGMLGANAIVGAAPPIAVGAALTAKTLKTGGVAMAFIGDGASNQGTVFEALNLASVLYTRTMAMLNSPVPATMWEETISLAAPGLSGCLVKMWMGLIFSLCLRPLARQSSERDVVMVRVR